MTSNDAIVKLTWVMFYNRLGFIHTETSHFSLPIVSCVHHCQLVKGGITLKIDCMYIVNSWNLFVYVFMSVVEPQDGKWKWKITHQ